MQLKAEHSGLEAFPDRSKDLTMAVNSSSQYRPFGNPDLRKEKQLYEHMLKQLGARLLYEKPGVLRPIEISKNRIYLPATANSFQLTIEWSESSVLVAPMESGSARYLIIQLPKDYTPNQRFQFQLDAMLAGHDLDRYTTSEKIQEERALFGDPRMILKPGQREAILHIASLDAEQKNNEALAVSIQAAPAYGKTAIAVLSARMRMRRAAKLHSPRNLFFVITRRVLNASQLGETFKTIDRSGLDGKVDYEVISWEKSEGQAESANMQDIVEHARRLHLQNKSLVVTVNWDRLITQMAKLEGYQSDLQALRAAVNTVIVDEVSRDGANRYVDTLKSLVNANSGTLLLGLDAEYLDPKIRDILFGGQRFDVYRRELDAGANDPSQLIIDHIRIGGERGEVTPLLDRLTDRAVVQIEPKTILEPLRARGVKVTDGVLFKDIPDAVLRSAVFGELVKELERHGVLRNRVILIRPNTVALAEQLSAYLNEYFKQNQINRQSATLHWRTNNPEEVWKSFVEEDHPKRVDILIAPQMANQALNNPRLDTVLLMSNEVEIETWLEFAGRAMRRYPGKQNALFIHLTDHPMIESSLIAGLRQKQSFLEDKLLNPEEPLPGDKERYPPIPFETEVIDVPLNPFDDREEWNLMQLIPVLGADVTDVEQVEDRRTKINAAVDLFETLEHSFESMSKDEFVDLILSARQLLVQVYGQLNHHSPLFDSDDRKLVEKYFDIFSAKFNQTSAGLSSLELPKSLLYAGVIRKLMKGMDPEILSQLKSLELEILLHQSDSFEKRMLSLWPVSEKDAKLRLARLGVTDLDQPGQKLAHAISIAYERLEFLQFTSREQIRVALNRFNIERAHALADLHVDGLKQVALTLSILFKDDPVFTAVNEHLRHLGNQLLKNSNEIVELDFISSIGSFLLIHIKEVYPHLIPEISSVDALYIRGDQIDEVVTASRAFLKDISKSAMKKDFESVGAILASSINDFMKKTNGYIAPYNLIPQIDRLRSRAKNLISLADWMENSEPKSPVPDFAALPILNRPSIEAFVGNKQSISNELLSIYSHSTRMSLLIFGRHLLKLLPSDIGLYNFKLLSDQLDIRAALLTDERHTVFNTHLHENFSFDDIAYSLFSPGLQKVRLSNNLAADPTGSKFLAFSSFLFDKIAFTNLLRALYSEKPEADRSLTIEEFDTILDDYLAKLFAQFQSYIDGANIQFFPSKFDLTLNGIDNADFFAKYTVTPEIEQMPERQILDLKTNLRLNLAILNDWAAWGIDYSTFNDLYLKTVFDVSGLGKWQSPANPKRPDFFKNQREKFLKLLSKVNYRLYKLNPSKYEKPKK